MHKDLELFTKRLNLFGAMEGLLLTGGEVDSLPRQKLMLRAEKSIYHVGNSVQYRAYQCPPQTTNSSALLRVISFAWTLFHNPNR